MRGAASPSLSCRAGSDDIAEAGRRRRAANRLGFAVQLSYLRHPGRPLELGENPPVALVDVLAGQLGCDPAAFADYAARETALREHRAEIETWFGLRAFARSDCGAMLAVGIEVAAGARSTSPMRWARRSRRSTSQVLAAPPTAWRPPSRPARSPPRSC